MPRVKLRRGTKAAGPFRGEKKEKKGKRRTAAMRGAKSQSEAHEAATSLTRGKGRRMCRSAVLAAGSSTKGSVGEPQPPAWGAAEKERDAVFASAPGEGGAETVVVVNRPRVPAGEGEGCRRAP